MGRRRLTTITNILSLEDSSDLSLSSVMALPSLIVLNSDRSVRKLRHAAKCASVIGSRLSLRKS